MNLETAFMWFEQDLRLPTGALTSYASEDNVGGYPNEWPVGSMFAVEGKILYALVRALRPLTVVEFGVRHGCSSKHILEALHRNGGGHLHSYDIAPDVFWDRFPKDILTYWTLHVADALTATLPERADIVFEDTLHSIFHTQTLIARGLQLMPRLVLSHDAGHFLVGKDVTTGFKNAVGFGNVFTPDGSDCGFIFASL